MAKRKKKSDERLPLPPSIEIDEVISQLAKKEDHALARAFREKRDEDARRDWGLLSAVFDFHFKASDASEPFGPMLVRDGKRSMIPVDLTDEQLDGLHGTLSGVTDPEYRARIGDIIWLRRRDTGAAHIAIDAYLNSGLRLEDPDHWVASMERYERAIRLGRSLGKKNQSYIKALAHLLKRIRHYNGTDPKWFSHHGLSLLYEFSHGDPKALSPIAEKIARSAHEERDYRRAWEHYELAAKFHRRAKERTKAENAMRLRAECMVDAAESQEKQGSFMVAHSFWNDAIQAYRQVPKSGERIKELHRRMNIAGQKMRHEMQQVSTEIDLSDSIERVNKALRGTEVQSALCVFAILSTPIDPEELRSLSERNIKEHPLHVIFEAQIFDAAGRKVDVRPSAFTDDPDQYERAIHGIMIQNAHFHRGISVAGTIAPALRYILANHTVDDETISVLMRHSGLIPDGRQSIFLRGIRLGFEWDFPTALHLLVPQLENALRHLLAHNGVITTSLDAIGIEKSWTLERVLAAAELREILGERHVYELRSLLLGQPGSNIRNLIAHGLIDDPHLSSHEAVYLWWLIYRLVLLPTPGFDDWISAQKEKAESHDADPKKVRRKKKAGPKTQKKPKRRKP